LNKSNHQRYKDEKKRMNAVLKSRTTVDKRMNGNGCAILTRSQPARFWRRIVCERRQHHLNVDECCGSVSLTDRKFMRLLLAASESCY